MWPGITSSPGRGLCLRWPAQTAVCISLVGIGIIAIPTGIIAAGFNQVINKENGKDDIETMNDEELLALQGRLNKQLSHRGYIAIVSKMEKTNTEASEKP